jgi:hypothetical protein
MFLAHANKITHNAIADLNNTFLIRPEEITILF